MGLTDSAQSLARLNRPRRWRLACGCAAMVLIVAAFSSRSAIHLVRTAWRDVDAREALAPGEADDASRLNRTKVAEVWRIPDDSAAAERQLADLLQRATRDRLRVSIAGARHSMGGHTIYPGGIVIDMRPFRAMTLSDDQRLLKVQAGATWEEIIPYLDAHDLSVAVMQSNSSFTVGGSLSANCHGWQYGQAPIASTVERIRLMTADGAILACSREEHAELFSLALGGYGLFGIILEAELRVAPNQCYRLEQAIVRTDQALATFDRIVKEHPDVEMMYARMNVMPERFLDEIIINAFYPVDPPEGNLPELHAPGMVAIRRSLFRGSAGSDYGKELRWQAETKLQPHLHDQFYSRNQLLNESTTTFENRSAESTDILHEYFVPRAGVAQFVAELKIHLPRRDVDLLNITIREVEADGDAFLRYADQPLFSFVMLFQQSRTDAAEKRMEALTRQLIDAAIASGGRYYLPYRLHATNLQIRQAYPQLDEFFRLKRQYDPGELFQNQFYLTYREPLTPP